MEPIQITVDKVLAKLEKIKKDNPQAKLKKYLTKQELLHIKFCNLRDGVMTINVDSSTWLYNLSLKKKDLISKLGLKDIRMRLGEVD